MDRLKFLLVVLAGFLCFTYSTSAREGVNDGLVVHYDFSEGSGNILHDKSGNGYNGKIHNATWVKSEYGSALHFKGKKSFVDCGKNPDFDMKLSDWTITVLVKIPPSSTNDIYLVCKGAGDGYNGYRFATRSGNLYAIIGPARPTHYISTHGKCAGSLDLNDNQWHFLAVVYNRKGNLQLYIDGVASGKPKDISTLANKNIVSKSGLRIFSGHKDSDECTIADVAIYRKSLSPQEIMDQWVLLHYRKND